MSKFLSKKKINCMFTLVCLFFVLYLGYVLLKPRFLEGLDGDQAVTENPIQKISI